MNSLFHSDEDSFNFLIDDFFQLFKECYCHFPEKIFAHFPSLGYGKMSKDVFMKQPADFIKKMPISDTREQLWAGKTLFENDIMRYINTIIFNIEDIPVKYEDFRKFFILNFSVEKDESNRIYTGININGSILEYDFGIDEETIEKYFQLKNDPNKIKLLKFHKELVYTVLVDKNIKNLVQIAKDLFAIKNDFEEISLVCPKNQPFIEEKPKKSSFNC